MKAASVSPLVLQIAFRALIDADMRKILIFLALSMAMGAAQAQIKCWNEGGRRVCGDAPPAGAKVTTLKAPSTPSAPEASTDKDAKKAPLTPSEREQEARKKQAETQKTAQKADEERKISEAKRENCERAKEALRGLDGGQRVMRIDSKGERYFLDEAQVAAEADRARQVAKDSCS